MRMRLNTFTLELDGWMDGWIDKHTDKVSPQFSPHLPIPTR